MGRPKTYFWGEWIPAHINVSLENKQTNNTLWSRGEHTQFTYATRFFVVAHNHQILFMLTIACQTPTETEEEPLSADHDVADAALVEALHIAVVNDDADALEALLITGWSTHAHRFKFPPEIIYSFPGPCSDHLLIWDAIKCLNNASFCWDC